MRVVRFFPFAPFGQNVRFVLPPGVKLKNKSDLSRYFASERTKTDIYDFYDQKDKKDEPVKTDIYDSLTERVVTNTYVSNSRLTNEQRPLRVRVPGTGCEALRGPFTGFLRHA